MGQNVGHSIALLREYLLFLCYLSIARLAKGGHLFFQLNLLLHHLQIGLAGGSEILVLDNCLPHGCPIMNELHEGDKRNQ